MAQILLIMGSSSDFEIVKETITILKKFNITFDAKVSSAHRTPDETATLSKVARQNGYKVIICFAGAAAHLAGVVASKTNLPIVAVPIVATSLNGLDALLSSVQMPGGIPVATMAIGKAGAKNAGLFATQILAINDDQLYLALEDYRREMKKKIEKDNLEIQANI